MNKLSRYSSNPGTIHWKALKRILIYLYHTRERKLTFGSNKARYKPSELKKNELYPLQAYVDADHAGCQDTARSTSGVIITLFGGTVLCKSKRQGKVSNSTGMAELHAVAEMTRKSDHYRQVLLDICGYHQKVFPIFTDSNVVIKMLERGNLSNQTKHLRISYHEVKENVESGLVSLSHIAGTENPSDICTKTLPRVSHEKHTNFILQDQVQFLGDVD